MQTSSGSHHMVPGANAAVSAPSHPHAATLLCGWRPKLLLRRAPPLAPVAPHAHVHALRVCAPRNDDSTRVRKHVDTHTKQNTQEGGAHRLARSASTSNSSSSSATTTRCFGEASRDRTVAAASRARSGLDLDGCGDISPPARMHAGSVVSFIGRTEQPGDSFIGRRSKELTCLGEELRVEPTRCGSHQSVEQRSITRTAAMLLRFWLRFWLRLGHTEQSRSLGVRHKAIKRWRAALSTVRSGGGVGSKCRRRW